MSEIKHGFFVAFAGSAIASLLSMYLPFGLEPAFKPELVECFPMPSTKGLLPSVKSEFDMVGIGPSKTEQERSVMQTFHERVKRAEHECTVEACEPAGHKIYRAAIWKYIMTRENITRNHYRENGEDGLTFAQEIFNTYADDAIVEYLQSLVRAGRFDLGILNVAKQSGALLVHKPTSAYVPCPSKEM
ncbi:MAG: hypothetical protein ABL893_13440 [Hyphomicrobium sp.]